MKLGNSSLQRAGPALYSTSPGKVEERRLCRGGAYRYGKGSEVWWVWHHSCWPCPDIHTGYQSAPRSNSISLRSTEPKYRGSKVLLLKDVFSILVGLGLRFLNMLPSHSENKKRLCIGCLCVRCPWQWFFPPPTPQKSISIWKEWK